MSETTICLTSMIACAAGILGIVIGVAMQHPPIRSYQAVAIDGAGEGWIVDHALTIDDCLALLEARGVMPLACEEERGQ